MAQMTEKFLLKYTKEHKERARAIGIKYECSESAAIRLCIDAVYNTLDKEGDVE